jgi:hypothetical protein
VRVHNHNAASQCLRSQGLASYEYGEKRLAAPMQALGRGRHHSSLAMYFKTCLMEVTL